MDSPSDCRRDSGDRGARGRNDPGRTGDGYEPFCEQRTCEQLGRLGARAARECGQAEVDATAQWKQVSAGNIGTSRLGSGQEARNVPERVFRPPVGATRETEGDCGCGS